MNSNGEYNYNKQKAKTFAQFWLDPGHFFVALCSKFTF